MNIGIIGTGNMGAALGAGWARSGHAVLFGSRDPAKAAAVALQVGGARSGGLDEAAAFGEVVLYTVRGIAPSRLLRAPGTLAGKIVIDCNNSDFDAERGEFAPPPAPSYAAQLARDAPAARVVMAFNTVPHRVLELPRVALAPRRISAFVCSDDPAATAVVIALAGDLGLVGVDCGALARAPLVYGVVDFIRYHIAMLGRGPLTTISLGNVGDPP